MTAPATPYLGRPLNPALLLTLLALAATGCGAAVVALVAAAPSAALLTTALLVLAGWLVRAAVAVPLAWLLAGAALAVLITVWPPLLLLVLTGAALVRGGPR